MAFWPRVNLELPSYVAELQRILVIDNMHPCMVDIYAIKHAALEVTPKVQIKMDLNTILGKIPQDPSDFVCVLQLASIPQCIVLEPALYHLQLSDGESFMNALLPFTGVDYAGSGKTWLYGEMSRITLYDFVKVRIGVERLADVKCMQLTCVMSRQFEHGCLQCTDSSHLCTGSAVSMFLSSRMSAPWP